MGMIEMIDGWKQVTYDQMSNRNQPMERREEANTHHAKKQIQSDSSYLKPHLSDCLGWYKWSIYRSIAPKQ